MNLLLKGSVFLLGYGELFSVIEGYGKAADAHYMKGVYQVASVAAKEKVRMIFLKFSNGCLDAEYSLACVQD